MKRKKSPNPGTSKLQNGGKTKIHFSAGLAQENHLLSGEAHAKPRRARIGQKFKSQKAVH
jgi:hypothetical protein